MTSATPAGCRVYLVDTCVISEIRKRDKANKGVTKFFRQAAKDDAALYLCAVTVGELRRGVELIHHCGDTAQAKRLDTWLKLILSEYHDNILPLDGDAAQVGTFARAASRERIRQANFGNHTYSRSNAGNAQRKALR